MPRKRLHGRTCGVSREGGRARALQPSGRSSALQLIRLHRSINPMQPVPSLEVAGSTWRANR
ncbi:hypothetical protein XarjCFBP7652_19690 [Xanthomonas arboricola]|nr:hypothetical protein XarbCFBP7629_19685 [Xanthomonas arboricola]PPT45841.1 hypothetical protein XarjCFBP7652_19690 [Xanthomonas arboricola]